MSESDGRSSGKRERRMDASVWTTIDSWFTNQLIDSDDALAHAQSESDRAGLRPISVTASLGKLLHILARLCGARRILEIGTLGGYSGIWLARALPADGRLFTLELDSRTADIARRNFAYAGLDSSVEIREGRAIESLATLAAEAQPPFDLVFIDADKEGCPDYFAWAIEHVRPGGVIVIDNVVRHGRVIDMSDTAPDVQGVRQVTKMVAAEPRVSATVIQTVGAKGHDGFLVALVVD